MATYAIGDVQGCYRSLRELLRRCAFDPKRDELWLTGDLVNRGPRSLDVLRWARDHSERITSVLGNHDLRLLAIAEGVVDVRKRDSLSPVLDAPDAAELIGWLSDRPLLHCARGHLLVHAGLSPWWSWQDAIAKARAVEGALRGELRPTLLHPQLDPALLQVSLRSWADGVVGQRLALAAMTRMRILDAAGRIDDDFSGPPEQAPPGCVPWFDHPDRRRDEGCVIFGHWATLGLMIRRDLIALDSGCVWGGNLSAVRLEDGEIFETRNLDR